MRRALILSLAMTLAGCAGSAYKLPSPVRDPDRYEPLGYTEAVASGSLVGGFIPANYTNQLERAVELAIRKRNGDAITDLDVKQSYFWTPIFLAYRIRVTGLVLRDKEPPMTREDFE